MSMEGATFLTRVVLENYKSIAHCDVRLGPLNYLVGPNGAGKSNFLDALRFVADALKLSIGQALRNRGGVAAICHAPHQRDGYFRIHLEFMAQDGTAWHYAVKIGHAKDSTPTNPWKVQEEVIGLQTGAGEKRFDVRGPFFGDRVVLALVAEAPEFREVYSALTRMLCYNIQPRSIKDEVTIEPEQFLLPEGSNLASAFFRLGHVSGEADDRINEYLRLILPSLIRVGAAPVGPLGTELPVYVKKVGLFFEQKFRVDGVYLFAPSQMSEGTLRSLGILTALLQATVAEGPRPSLVAIEEPEAQVHPAALAVLRDAMVEASYSTQVLVTTQSADILDNKDVATDSILAVAAEDGATRIAHIDATGRDLIRQRLYTPGELMRIGQLFPEHDPNGAPAASGQSAPVGGGA
jgi:predicted ATPase